MRRVRIVLVFAISLLLSGLVGTAVGSATAPDSRKSGATTSPAPHAAGSNLAADQSATRSAKKKQKKVKKNKKAPQVSRITPATAKPGATITLTGKRFLKKIVWVKFGSTKSPKVIRKNATTLTAVVPNGSGTVGVRVKTKKGTSTSIRFTYPAKPVPPKPTSPTISTTALPNAGVGSAYINQLHTADNRAGQWTWATGSTHPKWLTLSTTGQLSGTPEWTHSGASTVSIQFTDTSGSSVSKTLPITAVRVDLVTGENHSCWLKQDGTAWCWGANDQGQLGIGTTDASMTTAQRVATTGVTGANWTVLTAGWQHTCGLRDDGSAWCWGANGQSQLGLGAGDTANRSSPTRVGQSAGWLDLSAGQVHTCGVVTLGAPTDRGEMRCWGRNDRGQLGSLPVGGSKGVPTLVTDSMGVSWLDWTTLATAGATSHTCGIRTEAALGKPLTWCWGSNLYGQLGNNATSDYPQPHPQYVRTSENTTPLWRALTVGQHHTCAIRTDGGAWCWGWNLYGQLGDNTGGSASTPVQVRNETGSSYTHDWQRISAGKIHSCGVRSGRTAWCWGGNGSGQLGDDSSASTRLLPVQVTEHDGGKLADWFTVTAGNNHSCGLRTNGTAWCWGNNSRGQLGDGSVLLRPTPVKVK